MLRHTLWDAGHGGEDSGAINNDTGHTEKSITLAVALKCHEYSQRAGIPSSLVRSTDVFVPLYKRAEMANTIDADLCSIHCNAANQKAEGFEVFTSIGETASDSWATWTVDEYEKEFPERKFRYDFSDGDPDKEARFTVLTKTRGKAILFELGFIDSKEVYFLIDEKNIEKMAQALVNGRLRDLGLPAKNFLIPQEKEAPTLKIVDKDDNKTTLKERIENIEWQLSQIKKELNI